MKIIFDFQQDPQRLKQRQLATDEPECSKQLQHRQIIFNV